MFKFKGYWAIINDAGQTLWNAPDKRCWVFVRKSDAVAFLKKAKKTDRGREIVPIHMAFRKFNEELYDTAKPE